MKKPVILTVDDDVDVLRAVERDLRRQYGERFRVMRADSGATALELVQQLKLRNEALALFLVDQRMPRMSGVEFLEQRAKGLPDRETRPADGLRGHGCGYQRDQFRADRLLFDEALGSARGAALPGARRFA